MDLEAVLVNLLTNAYAACQLTGRKRAIRVELESKLHEKRRGVRICVADSGPGIAKEHQDRIWQPLFSTKINAKGVAIGTGLGLAIVQSIIDEWGGHRSVGRDDQLKGARFEIWLPTE